MSSHTITPEIQAAWRIVEANTGVSLHEPYAAEFTSRREEMALLLADIQRSQTVEKVAIFCKRALELDIFEQESLARSLVWIADLAAHPEAYPILECEEEFKQCMEDHHRRNVVLAEMAKEVQERLRNYAENMAKLAAVNEIIAEGRANLQLEQCEPQASVDYDSE